MDIESIVTQLMAIESAGKEQIESRAEILTNQQAALTELQAKIVALQVSAINFDKEAIFNKKAVSSSDETLLTASATQYATAGSYDFIVKRLASNHQLVTSSFSSVESPIGNGTISFEIGQGQLKRTTDLDFINGQQGITRGKLTITDSEGNTSDIDLTMALTMQDVLDAINKDRTIDVTASVSGDHLVLTDTAGGASEMKVEASDTADSLGLSSLTSLGNNRYAGNDIFSVSSNTLLRALNDGNGVRDLDSHGGAADLIFSAGGETLEVDLRTTMYGVQVGNDSEDTNNDRARSTTLQSLNRGAGVREGQFRITDQNGLSVDIDTTGVETLGELKYLVETTAADHGMDITLSFNGDDNLTVTDNSEMVGADEDGKSRSNFIIEDLDGGYAANDLGIVGDTTGTNIFGEKVWHMETLGDVMNAINNHWENDGIVEVSVNDAGTGLNVTATGIRPVPGSTATAVTVTAGENAKGEVSRLAADLGLLDIDENGDGGRLIAGLNTVMLSSLNGGRDSASAITEGGIIHLLDNDGNEAEVDLTGALTVQDVIDAINSSGTNITAGYNSVGNGLQLTDSSTGSSGLVVEDSSGTLAAQLGIAANGNVTSVNSGNLQLQYFSESMDLDELNHGEGVFRGKFTITDRDGETQTINLAQTNISTIEDVIDEINTAGTNIRARINDTGDGLLLYDDISEGNLAIKVADATGSTTASDLNIAGASTGSNNYIDGSFEFKIDLGGGDDLQDVVDQINEAGIGINATIVNDGSGYRISMYSEVDGKSGTIYIDPGKTSFTTKTLSKAQDAIVFFGSDSENPMLIHSSTNRVEDVVKGVTLDLLKASDEVINIEVSNDIETITSQISSFVENYNTIIDELDDLTSFNTSTYERGLLHSDPVINSIRTALRSIVSYIVPNSGSYNRMSTVGISYAPLSMETVDGKSYAVGSSLKLQFSESDFRAAYEDDPKGVSNFFTDGDDSMGSYISELLENLAGTTDSTITNRLDSMSDRQKLYETRIETMAERLTAKEERLYSQFYAMESALASMQSQQSALSSLSSIASSSSS